MFTLFNRYDSHLILKAIASQVMKVEKKLDISCIPRNKEKFLSFSVNSFVFLDSVQFLNASLSILADKLSEEGTNLTKFVHTHPEVDEEGFPSGVF